MCVVFNGFHLRLYMYNVNLFLTYSVMAVTSNGST